MELIHSNGGHQGRFRGVGGRRGSPGRAGGRPRVIGPMEMEGGRALQQNRARAFLETNRSWKAVDGFYKRNVRDREELLRLVPDEILKRIVQGEAWRSSSPAQGGGKRQRARLTYSARIGYHGTGFSGFAWQKEDENTIEAHLQRRLGGLLDKPSPVVSCSGRTDKGVHSVGQLVSFYSWKDISDDDIARALRERDPATGNSLEVYYVRRVPRSFHATFSCHWRYYAYVLPRLADGLLDVSPGHLRTLLSRLEGKELSYNAYARDTPKGKDTKCVLHCCRVTEALLGGFDGGEETPVTVVHLVGNRFLRRMVRVIVSTAVKEAMELAEEGGGGDGGRDKLVELCELGDRGLLQIPAPACGLCLVGAGYSPWE